MTRTLRAAAAPALAAAALLLASGPADAQAGEGRLFLTGGLQVVDTEELNERLEALGLPAFGEEHVTLGIGLDRRTGRWLLGAEGALVLAEETTAGGFRRSLDGRFGMLEAGYLLPLAGGLRAYPLAGVGLSSLELSTTRSSGAPGFDQLVQGTAPGSDLGTGGMVLQAGLGVDLSAGGFTVGVRGGYSFTPGSASWSWRGEDVDDGPDVGLDGPFVRAVLGLSD